MEIANAQLQEDSPFPAALKNHKEPDNRNWKEACYYYIAHKGKGYPLYDYQVLFFAPS